MGSNLGIRDMEPTVSAMLPSAKKRKEPPPNRTLIDFFAGSDEKKRARVRPLRRVVSSAQQAKARVVSRETIVIDSDSDNNSYGKEKAGVRPNFKTGASEDLGIRPRDEDIFGVPSELLRPIIQHTGMLSNAVHAHQQSPVVPESDQAESMLSVPAPLPERTCTADQQIKKNQDEFIAQNSLFSMTDGYSVDDFSVEFSVGEWSVADDELVNPEVSDNGADMDGGEPFDEHFCPVCGMGLIGDLIESQTHVNKCLDRTLQDGIFSMKGCPPVAASIKSDVSSGVGSPDTLAGSRGSDLYAVLMKSHKENEIWVEADATTDRNIKHTRGTRRKAPFYKVLQGMPIAVDAFCYGTIPGVKAYFLTHAHSDHYTTLGSKWNSGPIYCSEETANLITHMLSVNPSWIHPLPLDTPTVIPNTGGVSVTLIEANHCPGSCLFFFEGQQTIDAGDSAYKSLFVGSSRIFRYLHCGDFRASPRHVLHPAVNGKHVDHIYLDTTYLDSKYAFPPQPLVISACAELARRLVVGEAENGHVHAQQGSTLHAWMKSVTSTEKEREQTLPERTLVIVGTYSVGKERVVKAIAQALGVKIYCDPRKVAILRCQVDEELHALLTVDPAEAGVHILPLGTVTSDNLRLYLQQFKGTFSRIIGFRPTGWTYSPPPGSNYDNASIQSIITRSQSRHFSFADIQPSQKSSYNIQIFGVPYSEHSSFFELTCFAMSCDWGRMIPTVNVGSATSRAKMKKWLNRWESEKRCMKPYVIQPRAADYW